jgi:hypothetical protein
MKRVTIGLLLLVWTLALTVMTGQALLPANRVGAQAAKVRPKWEYASLVVTDTAAALHWRAGKTTLDGSGDVLKPDLSRGVNEVYRRLGGKDESPTLGMLLDLIGQDGWEMVSYTRPPGVQTWMFKRALP